mmetsp:Transcript_39645/g.122362  ORF Transcript_39645/g.122362 Transcript_39645/m.122362 type:complete len:384 (-) Transcript_39645:20-1171(-)
MEAGAGGGVVEEGFSQPPVSPRNGHTRPELLQTEPGGGRQGVSNTRAAAATANAAGPHHDRLRRQERIARDVRAGLPTGRSSTSSVGAGDSPAPASPRATQEPSFLLGLDCVAPPQSWQVQEAGESATERQLQPILRELDTLKLEAEAVLTAQHSEAKEQLARAREREAEARAAEEELRRARGELAARERDLAERERQLAARERELAGREGGVHAQLLSREQQVTGQEQRSAERETQIASRERRLVDREEQLLDRERRLAEREADLAAHWEQLVARREELEAQAAEVEQAVARLQSEEEHLRDWRRQLEEREQRWDEACREAQALKHLNPKPRISPRLGKENQDLQRQLEQQQGRIQDIKRRPESWGSETESAVRRDSLGAPL